MAQSVVRQHKGLTVLGVLLLLLLVLWLVWSWDWFLPIVEAKASAAAGRRVTAQHLHVHLWTTTRIELDGVRIDEPAGFPEEKPFATVGKLVVTVRPLGYLHGDGLVIPSVAIADGDATIRGLPDGKTNLDFPFTHPNPNAPPAKPGSGPKIGEIDISDTQADVAWAKLRAKFGLDIHTEGTGDAGRIVVAARGTYAGQPIEGHFRGGALLTLRDKAAPYPLSLQVANGPTHVSAEGTVENPLQFGGAHVRLVFAGPDMGLLYPLTGVPIPSTPAYHVAGNLAYASGRIAFQDFSGTLGSSDLEGTITVDPKAQPPDLHADLRSRAVDLADLGGFIGAHPGNTQENKEAHESKAAKGGVNVLPTTPINLPKLHAMNVDFHYRAGHIEGRSIPLDNLSTWFVIHDGAITVHQLNFGVGRGTLASAAYLAPDGHNIRAEATVHVRDVDLSHLLAATHVFHGSGIIGGQAQLRSTGNSIADLVAHGNGGVAVFMRNGGDVSALLPDIAGLEFGNAILSALGVPRRTAVQCLAAELPLRDGIMSTKLFVLQTEEARTTGDGTIDFRNDTVDYRLTTRSTRFSVGSLPGAIDVGGTLSSPSVLPGTEVIARTAGAVGLGVLFPPLAILPTVQFGVGKSEACEEALAGSADAPNTPAPGSTAGTGVGTGPAGTSAARPRKRLTPTGVHSAWENRLHHGG